MMTRRIARITMAMLAVAGIFPVTAFDWPLPRFRLESTFGSPRENYFQREIYLSTSEASIHSIAKGETVFFQKDGNRSASMPTPKGNMLAIKHSEGMVSVYSNLGRLSLSITEQLKEIAANTTIGTTGVSGYSTVFGFSMSIFDTKTAQWLNPLLVLPSRVDGIAPAIQTVALTDAGSEFILGKVTEIPQGLYTISAGIKDISGSPDRIDQSAPFEIQLIVDGKDVSKHVFDLLWWKDGQQKLFAPGLVSRNGFLDRNGRYRLLDIFLPRGKTTIGIIVMDAGGDRRKAEWTLQVH